MVDDRLAGVPVTVAQRDAAKTIAKRAAAKGEKASPSVLRIADVGVDDRVPGAPIPAPRVWVCPVCGSVRVSDTAPICASDHLVMQQRGPVAPRTETGDDAAAALVAALAGTPNAVVRAGSLVIAKFSEDGRAPAVLVRTLSSADLKALESDPTILGDSRRAFEFLSNTVHEGRVQAGAQPPSGD